jgi:opacity protein-like surface antigen
MICRCLPCLPLLRLVLWVAIIAIPAVSASQTGPAAAPHSHQYSYGIFTEYSPTSSHIILGGSRQRELFGVGGAFTWRLVARRSMELDYLFEVRPLLFESDPTVVSFYSNNYGYISFPRPVAIVDPGNLANPSNFGIAQYAQAGYSQAKFARRWTYNGGVSPFGVQFNGFKHRRIQPLTMLNGGLLVATREIPIPQSSYFNFTFQFGGGVEWYRTPSQSLLLEYRIHHFSNKNLGTYNPGTDSGIWNLTYRFGRR